MAARKIKADETQPIEDVVDEDCDSQPEQDSHLARTRREASSGGDVK